MARTPKTPTSNAAWAEWEELLAEVGGNEYTTAVLARLGQEGLATLRYKARRGCVVSAKALVERWLGLPEQTIQQQIALLNPEDAYLALVDHYISAGLPEATARRLAAGERVDETE